MPELAPIGSPLKSSRVELVPAAADNIDLLVQWTLDPEAQGPYKRVPPITPEEIKLRFLHSPDRWFFLIRDAGTQEALGRFYYRAWHFHSHPGLIDWELNTMIARPGTRGRGYGTDITQLCTDFLLPRPETHTIFAYTMAKNVAARCSLAKAGYSEVGFMSSDYYRVGQLPPEKTVLYVMKKSNLTTDPRNNEDADA